LFTFQLEFARDENAAGWFPPGMFRNVEPDVPLGPSISTALEQLGLRLAPDKGPRGYVVVDGVERPSIN